MSDFILPCIQPLLTKPGEYLANLIEKQASYLCCYNSNAQNLRDEAEKLEIARQTVQLQVDAAQRNLEDIRPDVADWLIRANETQAKSRILTDADNNVPKGCLFKWCPFLHYSSSREAKKTTDAIVKLPNDVKFERVSTANLSSLPLIPDTSAIGFESRDRIEKEIMDALKDDSVYLIGLCGMGGVGKTTMAEKIMCEAKTKTMFEVVVWATVSQSHDLKNVQQQIAEGFGLNLEGESEKIRTGTLLARLTNAKSFLIILDDVWKKLDLIKLGIPSQSTTEKRKLILTSRVQDVLTNDSKILTMDVLTEDEAWSLFREKAGESVNAVRLRETAKEVAKECKGLPLALVVMGSALREKNEHSWNDALRQLKRSSPEMLQEDYVQITEQLRWSYNQLQNKEAQYIFLLCCLFPEDYRIDVETLVRYGWGLRIFGGVENLSEARDRVHRLIERLKLCFLLAHAGDEHVKMHDVIRDTAISIASKDGHVFMVNDDRKEWPSKESYADYTHISVILSENFALPESIDCPKLEFLRMERNWREKKMSVEMLVHLFDRTRGLRVLELSGCKSLPSSTFGLTNLRALHLESCVLEMTSLVGKLENLEILNLSYSNFEELPKEVGQLKKLKLLNLTGCDGFREIAAGIISGLVNLEELLMFESFGEWEEEEDGKERKKASLKEVTSLGKLVNLHIEIYNPKLVALETQKLERYCIRIGPEVDFLIDGPKCEYKKIVYWSSTEESPLRNFCPSMTRNAEYFKLQGDGCIGIINDLVAVRYSEVLNANLKYLELRQINNMTGIFSCQISKEYFSKLEVLKVNHCYNLRNILAPLMFRGLTSLTKLELIDCKKLEEVIAQEEAQEGQESVEETLFPHLKELELLHLPKIRRFCHMMNALKLPSLEMMIVKDCPMLESFSMGSNDSNTMFILNKEVLCTNLKSLKLEKISNTERFSCGALEGNFNKLEVLEVYSCFHLRNILAPSLFRGLTSLTKLRLSNCVKLEAIFALEEAQEGQKNVFPFPHLKVLEFSDLPKMQRFCHMTNALQLPSLEKMTVKYCPILSFSINKELQCTNLCWLELKNVNGATGLFENRISIGNFSRLEIVKIESCYSLKHLFSPPMSRGLVNLTELKLKDCEEVEEVIAMDIQEGQRKIKEILFPKLEKLKLKGLPKFHRFCHMTEDLELTSLRIITIEDCPEMETFSLGSLHLPNLESVYGIKDSILAAKFLFNKKKCFEETHMDKSCIKLSVSDLSIPDWDMFLTPDSSSSFLLVAELCEWVELEGRCPMANLSMADAYEIFYVIMLKESADGWEDPVTLTLTLPEGITHDREENLKDKPRGQWLEILAGEFIVEPNQIGDFEFSLSTDMESGLLIEGVIIRPKSK